MSTATEIADRQRRRLNRIATEQIWRRADDRLISELDHEELDDLAIDYGTGILSRLPRLQISGMGRREIRQMARALGMPIVQRKLAERRQSQ